MTGRFVNGLLLGDPTDILVYRNMANCMVYDFNGTEYSTLEEAAAARDKLFPKDARG